MPFIKKDIKLPSYNIPLDELIELAWQECINDKGFIDEENDENDVLELLSEPAAAHDNLEL